jgi:hypothetical protein
LCGGREGEAILPRCAEAEGWGREREAAGGIWEAEKSERLHPCASEYKEFVEGG